MASHFCSSYHTMLVSVRYVSRFFRKIFQNRVLLTRGELSYLAPLGSEKISAPYFKQCFFRRGGIPPPPD